VAEYPWADGGGEDAEALESPPAVRGAGASLSEGGLTPRCSYVRASPPPSLPYKQALQG
jgi:hypothetical protein